MHSFKSSGSLETIVLDFSKIALGNQSAPPVASRAGLRTANFHGAGAPSVGSYLKGEIPRGPVTLSERV
jgi:hypothetical protein